MKIKTLLKTLKNTEYVIITQSGSQLDSGFLSNKDDYIGCIYLDETVSEVFTVVNCDTIFIRVK